MAKYHDEEWGLVSRDGIHVPVAHLGGIYLVVPADRYLFETLMLEGQEAGLSWAVVLRKRDNYRQAFHNFDVAKVAAMGDPDIDAV